MGRPPKGQLTQREVIIEALPACSQKESSGGTHRFSLRSLFYSIRPIIIDRCGIANPDYTTFCNVIADHERDEGPIDGMYREPRGKLYHPHTGEEIALGTLAVEDYERPEWTFNKILYIEKAGMFPTLIDVQWPERNDCALLSSQGYATGAVCDILDLLGDHDEEITVFLVHDADGPGTCIYEALQDGARSRPARKVKIRNLGLEPAEALAMQLQVEPVERKGGKKVPVADYVEPDWREWLQSKRVELNAMSTPAFLEWLDRKMAPYSGKLIPPDDVLQDRFMERARAELDSRVSEEVRRKAQIDEKIEAEMDRLTPILDEHSADALEDLPQHVEARLAEAPDQLWTEPVDRVARRLAWTLARDHLVGDE